MMTLREIIYELVKYDPDSVMSFTYVTDDGEKKFLTLEKITPVDLRGEEKEDGTVEFTKMNGEVVAWQKGIRIPASAKRNGRR